MIRLLIAVFVCFCCGTVRADGTSAGPKASNSLKASHAAWRWDFPVQKGKFGGSDYVESSDDPVCPELKAYLNAKARSWMVDKYGLELNYCAVSASSAPIFTPVPWEHLDPATNLALIETLLRYRDIANRTEEAAQRWTKGVNYRQRAEEFISEGGQIDSWKRSDSEHARGHGADRGALIYPSRTVVRLRLPQNFTSEEVKFFHCALREWVSWLFEIDDQLAPVPASYPDYAFSELVMYKGAPLLIGSDSSSVTIRSPEWSSDKQFCTFVKTPVKTK